MRGICFGVLGAAIFAAIQAPTSTAKASFMVRLEVVGRDADGNPVLIEEETLTDSTGMGRISSGLVSLRDYTVSEFVVTSTLNDENRLDPVTEGELTINGVARRTTPNTNNEELRIWVSDTGFRINQLPRVRSRDSAEISFGGLPTDLSYTLASFVDPMDRLFGLDAFDDSLPLSDPQSPVISNTLLPATTSIFTRAGGTPFQELSPAPEMISITNRSAIILTGPSSSGGPTLEQLTFTGTTTLFAVPEPTAAITLIVGAAGLTLLLRRRTRRLNP